MEKANRHSGSVFLIVVFAIALLAMITVGILQISTEELQLMQNQLYAAEALATAEAGLNDAFAQIRADSTWAAGFVNKAFNGGSYTVTVAGSLPDPNVTSTGTSSQGYVARVQANLTISASSPYIIRIDRLRINE